ncbi:2-keto-4-pentenoate hydratase [Marmoricola sp. OAE513]|uniref:2-keto-4-pentenoate hydratase n=1 Tax=Marmoricola sp. OAE513 TaxID=2817894 RepID=UPI001AE2BD7F
MTASITDAADRLSDAAAAGKPCAPVRDLIALDDTAAAYAVQTRNIEARTEAGARVVGRKIGLTSPAVQAQLGVDQPDFGVLLDDMDVSDETAIPFGRLLQPKVEAELAFVLGADAKPAYALAALEIVDSRIADWDITFVDTVADNGSSGLFVLGKDRLDLDEFNPRDVVMTMWVDGVAVSKGSGDACLGNPLSAVEWLAETAAQYGAPLEPGQVILSGALGPMVALKPNSEVRVTLTNGPLPLGSLTAFVSSEGTS